MRPLPERYILRELEHSNEKHQLKPEHKAWTLNVRDKYKPLSQDEIKQDVAQNRLPFAFLMTNISIDYNLGAVVRVANALGGKVYYYGNKRLDRRGMVGTHNYTPVIYLEDIEKVQALKRDYEFVGMEQTDKSCPLSMFDWTREKSSLILLGSEASGLQDSPEIMSLVDRFVEVAMRGSVRSMNVATCAAIAAYDFTSKYLQ